MARAGYVGGLCVTILFAGVLAACADGAADRVGELAPTVSGALQGQAPNPDIATPAPEQPAPEQPAPEQQPPPAPEQQPPPAPEQQPPPAPEQQPPPAPAPEQQPPPPQDPVERFTSDWWWLLPLSFAAVVGFLIYRAGRSSGQSAQARGGGVTTTVTTDVHMPPPPPPAPAPVAAPPPPQPRYVFYPGMETITPLHAPPLLDRSYTLTVELTRDDASAEGVLVAHGSSRAGYVLYIKDNRLHYTAMNASRAIELHPKAELPIGELRARFEFSRTGPGRGTGALFVNDKLVNAQIFDQLPQTALVEGLDIGVDRGLPVSTLYQAPFPFAGTIQRVVYELGEELQ